MDKLLLYHYEDINLEYKAAKDGFPKNFWSSYSALANSKGGYIYLGISELKDGTIISSRLTIEQINKYKKELFSNVNNLEKVSVNLLDDDLVSIKEYDGYPVLEIKIIPCPRQYKPVYINNNIITGTYRRHHEGDYRCGITEIKAMLRDAEDASDELNIIPDMTINDLCEETINSYYSRFCQYNSSHIFQKEGINRFLEYIGAIRLDKDNIYHPTKAGLLMFGYSYKIAYEFPHYFLDYQELYDTNLRWTDRINTDTGNFSGNLFDFYNIVVTKLTSDIKTPFKMEGLYRIDENNLHKAVREGLCNAIVNTDFNLRGGLVIKKYSDRIEYYNPGVLRMPAAKAFKGGMSDVRNETIFKMLALVGIGERAGSGLPLILSASKEFNLDKPLLEDMYEPDRTKLVIYLIKSPNILKEKVKVLKPTDIKRDRVLTYLANAGISKVNDIADELGYSVSTVKQILYKLVASGIVSTTGTIKDKKYYIN